MPNANIAFKRGLLANMPSTKNDGTIYITTDEHAMYVDVGNSRIRLGDFIPVETINDLPVAGHAYETAVYYVKQGNILARWDADEAHDGANARWIQINKAGVVGVTTATGSTGNAISEISTVVAADGTLQLQVTKVNLATAASVSGIDARLTAAESTISGHTSAINTLNGDDTTSGSIAYAIKTAQEALIGSETTYTTLESIGDAIRSLLSTTGSHTSSIAALQATVGSHTTILTTLQGDETVSGSIRKQVADAVAGIVNNAPEAYDTLKEISDWISSHADSAAAMNSTITTHSTQIAGLQAAVNTLNGDANTSGSVANSIANALSSVNTDISDLETRMSTAEGNITSLQSTTSGHTTSIAGLDTRVTAVENTLTWVDFE